METPTLWEKLPADDLTDESLEARFARYHRDRPDVYDRLLNLAEQMFAAGHRNVSMRDLFGWTRVERLLTRGPDREEFALNNSYAAFYARLIMEHYPHLEGLFVTRKQEADK